MLESNKAWIETQVRHWLAEDIGHGDITSLATVPSTHHSKGIIHMKQAGIVCGLPLAATVFNIVDQHVVFTAKVKEGSQVSVGTTVAIAEGHSRSILKAERLALNLLQHLSGIATQTEQYVKTLDNPNCRIVDTRKTTPGLRLLEKYAVRMGGGYNHRFGLHDAVLIKDNHIKASGGVSAAVHAAKRTVSHTIKIEVEVESLEQVQEAIDAGADIIMLDNMSVAEMKKATALIKANAPHIITEASGGVNLHTVQAIGQTGVDIISVGSLTSTIHPLDISLDLNDKKEGTL